MVPLSVAIITFNEEKNLDRCLQSVQALADEIIILDSFSTDQTEHIALQHGAHFVQEKFKGYIEQKNRALELTSNSFVLSLDADESLNTHLQNAIRAEKEKGFPQQAYRMNRCTSYCGKFIRHGIWYPDRKIRLLNKASGQWGGVNPHDRIILKDGVTASYLPGEILHYSFSTMEELIQQGNKFSTISADQLFKQGKRTSLLKILVNPAWAFFNGYILRLGFLDGLAGLVIARSIAFFTFQKHVKLWQHQKNEYK